MKISEIKGEQALDAMADIIDPLMDIISDEQIEALYRSKNRIKMIQMAIKNHKESVIKILAILDGEDPETYSPSLLTLPKKILEVLNDPELNNLFPSQDQNTDEASSGLATETTEAEETA